MSSSLYKWSLLCFVLMFIGAKSVFHEAPPVTEVCMGCLCKIITDCDESLKCDGVVCGLFGITWAYWVDAGKPTVKGDNATSDMAYQNCAIDRFCAARTVQFYNAKFGLDCNNDGVINCHDYVAMHMLGRHGCTGTVFSFTNKLNQCLSSED